MTDPWFAAIQEILDAAHLLRPDRLAGTIADAAARLGLRTRIWLVDYEQVRLHALGQPGSETPEPLPIGASLAGRAFARVASIRGDGGRWWVPMVDGTDRLGVIEFAPDDPARSGDDLPLARCELLAGLAGHLIAGLTSRGDHLHRARRTQPITPAAELLWQLLPPLTASCDQAVVSAVLQPCYEVGGDGFDYAIDGDTVQLVILDAVGKGVAAGVACAVALAAVRAARRNGRDLADQAQAADTALSEQFPEGRFVTAVLAELRLDTGALRYLNAGHPEPLLLRSGRLVRELPEGRRLPLGFDDPQIRVAEESLEPGDRLLLYTDGVTEAHTRGGERFGLERLVDLVEQNAAAGLPAPETLRRLAHAVVEHQGAAPGDDATLLVLEWSAAAARNTVPEGGQR
ncbi:PP2C family protein-serine/threonine phosphatase [Actinoplanes siamensis]|uniref:Phosphatase n=1 Tax=Actinoplanes siamensis TaxID=1223317 RepID=A0A919N618_9ACTN|nr:PP2C family protein-serine/threonine phosphatase [Actinoplanes siamensis]GIF05028.1 phosphatase [Actinoplanes siamensis]